MPDDDTTDDEGTTNQEYRWKWLSTVYVLAYSLGFPAWVFGSSFFDYALNVDGALMGPLVLVWLACVAYVVGPETVKAAKALRE